jgi:hypothetical protein
MSVHPSMDSNMSQTTGLRVGDLDVTSAGEWGNAAEGIDSCGPGFQFNGEGGIPSDLKRDRRGRLETSSWGIRQIPSKFPSRLTNDQKFAADLGATSAKTLDTAGILP